MKNFSLLIKPASADCNLRCEYCFYLGHQSFYPEERTHRMSHDTLETMIRSYMRTPQPQYTFTWQGGEPLLMGAGFFRHCLSFTLAKKFNPLLDIGKGKVAHVLHYSQDRYIHLLCHVHRFSYHHFC